MARLLVIAHSRTGGTRRLVDAALAGARDPAIEDVEVVEVPALDARAPDVLAADAVLLATPENLGYMSGAMKHFFDESFRDLEGGVSAGLPYGLLVKASTDGTGAIRAVQRVVKGLGWKAVAEPVLVVGDVTDAGLEAATELGATLAAGLTMELW